MNVHIGRGPIHHLSDPHALLNHPLAGHAATYLGFDQPSVVLKGLGLQKSSHGLSLGYPWGPKAGTGTPHWGGTDVKISGLTMSSMCLLAFR